MSIASGLHTKHLESLAVRADTQDVTGTIDAAAYEHLLVRLQDLATDLMTVIDVHCNVLYLNPAARVAYGIAAGAGVGENLADHLRPDALADLQATAVRCMRTGRPGTMSLTIDGGIGGDLRLETAMTYDPDTQLFYSVQRDVSGAIHEARSLEIAERFLALTGDAIAMLDDDGIVLRTNQAFDALFNVHVTPERTRLADVALSAGAETLLDAFDSIDEDHPSTSVDVSVDSHGDTRIVHALLQLDEQSDVRYLVARDVTDERQLRSQLEQRAGFDALTELSNRAAFIEALEQHCAARREAALVLIDLDGFKEINDAHGHATGDALLSLVAERLNANVGDGDMIARLGGDEFVVMTTTAHPLTAATAIARQLRRTIGAPYDVNGTQVKVSASIGIAATRSDIETQPSDVLHEADAAMYAAKRTGRNKFVVFDHRLRAETERHEQLGNEIEAAMACGQIDIDVQAIYNLSGSKATGAEALVRWNHPTRGRLTPADFLDLVVEKNLMMELTRQVLARTVDGLGEWLRADRLRGVSFNVSPMQLRDPELVRYLIEACAREDIEHQQLICEFTEERLVDTIERTAELLQTLRSAGFRIAIDDFGAGASSLAYFRLLPIDFVKIDRGLIDNIPHSTIETTVVKAIAELAMELGFAVCAEGVSAADQIEWLRGIDCRFAQGFHLHRPEPVADFLAR